jgi:hypothetical protein
MAKVANHCGDSPNKERHQHLVSATICLLNVIFLRASSSSAAFMCSACGLIAIYD